MITKQMLLDSYHEIQNNNHTGTMSCLLDLIRNLPGEPIFDISEDCVKDKKKGRIEKKGYIQPKPILKKKNVV